MPQVNCRKCDKKIRNPPSRVVTGYCSKCLGLQHKKALDKINNLWDKVTNNG